MTIIDTGDIDIQWVIDQAADRIENDTLAVGELWHTDSTWTYQHGCPVCVIGALAVSCGMRDARQVEADFCGMEQYDAQRHVAVQNPIHPVLQAVMAAMCFTEVEQVMDWSDRHSDACVVETLRDIAAELREKAGAAA